MAKSYDFDELNISTKNASNILRIYFTITSTFILIYTDAPIYMYLLLLGVYLYLYNKDKSK